MATFAHQGHKTVTIPYASKTDPDDDQSTISSDCSCANFCAGRCAPFSSGKLPVPAKPSDNGTQIRNVTWYRFTPRSIRQELANTNTGDVDGDLGFFLDRRALTARCALEPTSLRCFLAPWSEIVFARWELAVDTGWGPYLACNPAYSNPNGTSWDLSHYMCSQACVVPPFCGDVVRKNNTKGGDGQVTCYCERANRTVGVESMGSPTLKAEASPVSATQHLPAVCRFGASSGAYSGTPALPAGACLHGEKIKSWQGSDLNSVSAPCCAACEPPECTGFSVTKRTNAASYQCETLRGAVTPEIPTNGTICIGSSERDPLPGGSWNWGVMGVSGGAWYSTPAVGQCLGDSRPGDGSGCTWKILSKPSFIESTCVNEHLDAAVMKAAPSCFAGCGKPVEPNSECFYRCYWLALNKNLTEAKSLWSHAIKPAFTAAWNDCPFQ